MENINFLALGGQDELQNDLFVLEFNDDIYILECGIEEPVKKNYGIKYFIPKMDYLINRKDKIKGIFLSSALFSKLGSLDFLVQQIPNIRIFASKITLLSLKIYFGEKVEKWNLIELTNERSLKIEDVIFTPFSIASTIPGAFGFNFQFEQRNIVYMTNYIFDSILEYNIPITSIIPPQKNNTFILLTDAINASIPSNYNVDYKITHQIEETFKIWNRKIFVSVYEENIINIIEIIALARNFQRKVYFTNEKTYELIKIFLETGAIKNFKFDLLNKEMELEKDAIIIFSDSKATIFHNFIDFIQMGKATYFAEISPNDLVVFASPPQSGNEHIYAKAQSELTSLEPKIIEIKNDTFMEIHPKYFDLKNYLQILNPKYIIPIKGYYKEQILLKKVFVEQGNSSENLLISMIGEKTAFRNWKYIGSEKTTKEFGKTIIENVSNKTITSLIIEERQNLGHNGIVTIGLIVSSKTKKILTRPDLQMRGVVFLKNQSKLIEEISNKFIELTNQFLNEDSIFDKNKVAQKTTKEITKIFKQSIKKTPILIVKILDNDASKK